MSSTTPARGRCCSTIPSPEPSSRCEQSWAPSPGATLSPMERRDHATHSYEEPIAAGRAPPQRRRSLRLLLPGLYIGHDGLSKGVRQSASEFADCLRRIATIYGITGNDRELVAAPLFHEAPALFALLQIFGGGTVIVTSELRRPTYSR